MSYLFISFDQLSFQNLYFIVMCWRLLSRTRSGMFQNWLFLIRFWRLGSNWSVSLSTRFIWISWIIERSISCGRRFGSILLSYLIFRSIIYLRDLSLKFKWFWFKLVQLRLRGIQSDYSSRFKSLSSWFRLKLDWLIINWSFILFPSICLRTIRAGSVQGWWLFDRFLF